MTVTSERMRGFVMAATLAAVVGLVPGGGPALAASRGADGGASTSTASGRVNNGLAESARSGPSCLVVDADDAATLRLQCGGELRIVRLASVHAPRPGTTLLGGEPYGTEGQELVRGWFVGKRVEVSAGTVRLGGEDVRLGLLRLGLVDWAGSATTAGEADLGSAEREARLASRGLWSYDAWRRHQATARVPLLVNGPPPRAVESIGVAAARFSRKSEVERRAAFDAAVAQLKTLSPVAAAKPAAEAGAPKAHRRTRGSRHSESAQPR
ncbi:MAG TPA: hypothetical protein VGS57_02815 [Thermoanaerobaculia bacterium]|jgi:endonuclease YncB( thermonuclease family)|nr:hypothetical protein [Thermoanaerobaculia bacterium]